MQIIFGTAWLKVSLLHTVNLVQGRFDIAGWHLWCEVLVIAMPLLTMGNDVAACHVEVVASPLHFKLAPPNLRQAVILLEENFGSLCSVDNIHVRARAAPTLFDVASQRLWSIVFDHLHMCVVLECRLILST